MAAHKILVVEDDQDIAPLLQAFLTREGFSVETAADGAAMDARLATAVPDLMVLDLMLPGEDGLSICRRLRRTHRLPILMLTAKSDVVDRIIGLEVGADDYLCKPFKPQELLARIRAILRRGAAARTTSRRRIAFADFILDQDTRSVATTDGREIVLTAAEFDMLQTFVENPQRVLTRRQLAEAGHGRFYSAESRGIDVTVSHLRRKLSAADDALRGLIVTVRGDGYRFAAPVQKLKS